MEACIYSIVNNPQLDLSKSVYDNYIPGGLVN